MSGEPATAPDASPQIGSVAIVGAGAMGSALAAGIARSSPAIDLVLVDARADVAEAVAQEVGGRAARPRELPGVDLVVLAVKPGDVPAAAAELARALPESVPMASVVAGLDLARLSEAAPGRPVVRLMPNLAVRHGAGLIAMCASEAHAEAADALERLLEPLGEVVRLDERHLPAATALGGSGPGLVALVIEALEEGGVSCGLPRPAARRMAVAATAGTAALLADGEDPAALRQRVTSPGGTTAAGVAALERGAVRSHVADAVRSAAARAAEL